MSIGRKKTEDGSFDAGLKKIKTVDSKQQEFCVKQARLDLANRGKRYEFLPSEFFGEPGWQMLLELYVAHYQNDRYTVTDLCIASNEPRATALRWIDILKTSGLLRTAVPTNDTEMKISLSDKAIEQLTRYFLTRSLHTV